MKKYRVVYADPPWSFATYSHKGKGSSAEAHYDCMTPVYRLKRKLMAACYPGVEITEVTDPAWVPAVAP